MLGVVLVVKVKGRRIMFDERSDGEGFKVFHIPYMASPLLWANFNEWLACFG